jgi:Lon protease-like protein
MIIINNLSNEPFIRYLSHYSGLPDFLLAAFFSARKLAIVRHRTATIGISGIMTHPLDTQFEELPQILPVFPLRRVILLPDIPLPLNVFEPRYLHMVLDALAIGRLIGIIQPDRVEEEGTPAPQLAPVGCVGRITNFSETDDGRLLISLTGICRFQVQRELPLHSKGYRLVEADYNRYKADILPPPEALLDLEQMKEEFALYLKKKDCAVDWASIANVPGPLVVDYLSAHLPFNPEEKQALLEAAGHEDRLKLMRGFAKMEARTSQLETEASHAKH